MHNIHDLHPYYVHIHVHVHVCTLCTLYMYLLFHIHVYSCTCTCTCTLASGIQLHVLCTLIHKGTLKTWFFVLTCTTCYIVFHSTHIASQLPSFPLTSTPLSDTSSQVHQTYQVMYIQEVILPTPSLFEENMMSALNSFVLFNKAEIINTVQEDQRFLRQLFSQLQDEATPEGKYRELVSAYIPPPHM